jgi:membrane fusion protein, adhesin transport system
MVETSNHIESGSEEKIGLLKQFSLWSEQFLSRLMNKLMPVGEDTDYDWQLDADRALVEQTPVRSRALLYCVALSVIALIIWAAFAEIDEVTRGEGKVIPSRQVQILQSLDGGVVTEIAVQEGDVINEGDLLVRLDATRFVSSLRESQAEVLSLQAKRERLLALAEDREFAAALTLREAIPQVVKQERELYLSSRDELAAETAIAEQQLIQRQQELVEAVSRRNNAGRSYELAARELQVTRPLMDSGAISEVELLRLEREVSTLKGELDQALAQVEGVKSSIAEAERKRDEVVLEFKNRVREELSVTTTRLNSLEESTLGLSDRVKLTELRSPVRGTIKRLYYNTIGGVVLPGKEVVEVVPLDDSLLLEARIRPQDIAFLRPGQEAMVKFTAYDFVIYGGLEAAVEHIGADTVMDEEGNPFYNIRVRTRRSQLDDDKPIIPGMVAEVDILTGKKTILAYLMKPISRARQYALTER